MKGNIFYSWQSDLPNSTNRNFILDALEGAAKDVKREEEITIEPVIDRDTAGVAGAPDIGLTILAKIDAAVAFVCDVSLVTADAAGRPSPNPNVLVELGYALRALGLSKIILVMNTAFGRPEKLPFDLRQKRATTYHLPEGAEKAPVRKDLRAALGTAISLILREHQEAAKRDEPPPPRLSEEAFQAVRAARADQAPVIARFMASLAAELRALNPHGLSGEPDENLVLAIDKISPLVDEFGRVAQIAAEMDAREATVALYKGLENVIKEYDYQPSSGGAWAPPVAHDLFKFAGHELCTVLIACLMRAGRWQLIDVVARETLFWHRPDGGPTNVGVALLSENVALLDEVRSKRLAVPSGRRKVSIHAELLKERHERIPPVGGVDWDDFRAADLLLCLRTFDGARRLRFWFPRTSIYQMSPIPRFLQEAKSISGARNLAAALGETDLGQMKERVRAGLGRLGEAVLQLSPLVPFQYFDVDSIATTPPT